MKEKIQLKLNINKRLSCVTQNIINYLSSEFCVEEKDLISPLCCEGPIADSKVNGYYTKEMYSIETEEKRFEIIVDL